MKFLSLFAAPLPPSYHSVPALFLRAACVLLAASRLSAAPSPVTSITSTPDGQLTGFTASGEAFTSAQFVPGNLTVFTGGASLAVVAPGGAPPAVNTRAGLLGDLFLTTGVINPAVTSTDSTYAFTTPVLNRTGPDIVIMELNAVPGTDGMFIRINGQTATLPASLWGNTGVTLSGLTEYSAGTAPANLAALQAANLTVGTAGRSLNVFGIAVDLSDFGIALGSTLSSFTFGSNLSTNLVDPVLIMGLTPPVTGGPVISEIMASNKNGLEDEDTDRPDWIEIYNGQNLAANLAGWTLTDDASVPGKWTFPSINVPAFGYTYIFASGKNRFTNLHAHTNFTLDSNAGVLLLNRPNTSNAATLTWGAQQEDVSYGTVGATLTRRFFETPTPGSATLGRNAVDARVEGPLFNRDSGILTAAVTLTVSLPISAPAASGAVIRYTVDGTDPLETSPLFPASLTIATGTNIAARVYQPGYLPSPVHHRNFIFLTSDIGTNYNASGAPFSSSLPVVVLDSYGVSVDSTTDPTQPRPYRFSQAAIYDVDPSSGKASLGSPPTLLSRAATHVRGQSSSSFAQRPYALEFWNPTSDTDRNVELLGFPSASDWVLQTLYADKTFQRNKLMQDLMLAANGAGPGHRCRFVEVFFNQDGGTCSYADYRGVYLLMEPVKRGNNRLAIEKLNSEMTEAAKLSGGYIFAKDKTPYAAPISPPNVTGSSWNGLTYDINDPEPPTTAQQNWLLYYLNQTDTAIMQSDFANPSSANYYGKWLDPRSFIDKQIWMETCKEVDSYIFSYYYYKDRDQPLKADLLWDVDRSLGNSNYGSADTAAGWKWWIVGNGYAYFPQLFTDPEFTVAYWDRWWSLRQGLFSTPALMARIEATTAQLTNGADAATVTNTAAPVQQNPAARHFRRYQTLGNPTFNAAAIGQADRNTFRKELDYMKTWLNARLDWMDSASPLRAPALLNAATGQPLYGGAVTTGQGLRFYNPNGSGTIIYTVNGPDPRLTGGNPAPAGLTANSSGISITPIMAAGQSWKWLRPASEPASWKTPAFDDTSWARGNAPLGYGETSGLATNIAPTPPNYQDAATEPGPTYFRRTFTVSGLAGLSRLRLEIQADDGAVVYLNGTEAARIGYPYAPTAPSFTTEASGVMDDARAESAYDPIEVPASLLVEGVNTIAVEVHQGYFVFPPVVPSYPNNSYSDMRFDLRIHGIAAVPAASPTTLSLTTPGTVVVRSRVLNGSTWSGLTESTFIVQTVPATAANLVVSALHYQPLPPTPAELSAGFTSESAFEWVELLNIHPTANLDLSGLAITRGLTFSFNNAVPETRYLAPGNRVLLVANPAAFASRLAPGSTPVIAGTWTGSLSNGGENLTLLDATGTIIKAFTYDDDPPWPKDADGRGRSLVLLQPFANPDHSLPANWRASATNGDTPGSADSPPLPANPEADDNGNGFPNLIEFLMGPQPALQSGIETVTDLNGASDRYLVVRFPRDLAAGNALLFPELSTTLASNWSAAAMTFLGWDTATGTQSGMTWRSTQPVSALGPRAYIRLRALP